MKIVLSEVNLWIFLLLIPQNLDHAQLGLAGYPIGLCLQPAQVLVAEKVLLNSCVRAQEAVEAVLDHQLAPDRQVH